MWSFVHVIDDLQPWMKWAYYLSPMSYGQNAIVLVEFLDKRWSAVSLDSNTYRFRFYLNIYILNLFDQWYCIQPNFDSMYRESTVGKELLKARGMFTEGHWYWICVLALFGFSLVFNVCFVLALTFLTRKTTFQAPISQNSWLIDPCMYMTIFVSNLKMQPWRILNLLQTMMMPRRRS